MRRTRQSTKLSNDDSTIVNLQHAGRYSGTLEPNELGINTISMNSVSNCHDTKKQSARPKTIMSAGVRRQLNKTADIKDRGVCRNQQS